MKSIVLTGTVEAVGPRSITVTFRSEGSGFIHRCDIPADMEQQREWSSLLYVAGAVVVSLDVSIDAPEHDVARASTEDLRAELARREERGAA